MPNISTTYLGLKINSPIIAASSPLTRSPETIEQMAELGIGAVVLPSLFEEQLTIDGLGMESWVKNNKELLPGKLKHFPDMSQHNEGIANYMAQIFDLKRRLDIPIIASLNGTSLGGWLEYATLLSGAGADALELNLYDVPMRAYPDSADMVANYRSIVHTVAEKVDIPVSVKISPYFASLPNVVMQFVDAGAKGCVLFNRFYQPDVDLETEQLIPNLNLSTPEELRMRLRWTAILYDQIVADIAITGGVHSADDVAKSILTGAQVVTIASVLLDKGIGQITELNNGLVEWLDRKGYHDLKSVRGKLSQKRLGRSEALTRANYIRTIGSYADEASEESES